MFDWKLFFTVFCIFAGGGPAFYYFRKILLAMKAAKPEHGPLNLGKRTYLLIRNMFFQAKMFKDFWPGLMHLFFFWGFIVVTIGTLESVIEGLFHGFSFGFLGPLHHFIVLSEDFFQPLILVAIVYGLARRTLLKPKRMKTLAPASARDGLIILFLIALHMLANMVHFSGFMISQTPISSPEWRPFTQFLASILFDMGMGESTGLSMGYVGWTLHMISVFGLMAYLPHSKHFHIATVGPNIFLARLEPKGTFSKINFEDETQTTFGVSKITQFTWKDILDLYTCTECGRCNEYCPTATTDKPLRPRELIMDLKRHVKTNIDAIGKTTIKAEASAGTIAELETDAPLISDQYISEDTIWACTTCRACVESCPVMIEHVDKIIDMRRNLVMMEGRMPVELQNALRNFETQSNPWGISNDARDEWAKELNIPRLVDKPDTEYLFYVGCAGSFNDRNKKIASAFAKILQKSNIDFAILGKEELCNGETARRAGNEYLAATMIGSNIEVLKRYNVKKILTICPHCFNTLKNEYPDFGFQADEVVHHTEFIDRLMKQGKLQVKTSEEKLRITFHDSCYLGRYNEVYEQPRDALRALPGVEVIEMPRNRSKGLCCGAGGARMWMEETIGKRINVERTEEALTLKPDVIAAGCPFCQVMLSDGVTGLKEEKTQVLDLAEIVESRI